MCAIDDAEPWTVFTSTMRRAAKSHTCGECHRTIEPFERYEYAKGMIDKTWLVYRTCEHCIAARSWLLVWCRGWMYEYVLEELGEHWIEGYRSFMLGRFIIGMRRKWVRRDGSMMPVPAHAESYPEIEDAIQRFDRMIGLVGAR